METFEVAKKAADAAVEGGGSPEEGRCVDALKRLRKMPVTMDVLVKTQVFVPSLVILDPISLSYLFDFFDIFCCLSSFSGGDLGLPPWETRGLVEIWEIIFHLDVILVFILFDLYGIRGL